jgi:hypothetical protein
MLGNNEVEEKLDKLSKGGGVVQELIFIKLTVVSVKNFARKSLALFLGN